MNRLFIEAVRCDMEDDTMQMPAMAEAKVRMDSGEIFYMMLTELEGIPNFFRSPESIYDLYRDPDVDEEVLEGLMKYFVDTGDYDEIFEVRDPEWLLLYRYLIYIIRTEKHIHEHFMHLTCGQWLDEIGVPVSDIENCIIESKKPVSEMSAIDDRERL